MHSTAVVNQSDAMQWLAENRPEIAAMIQRPRQAPVIHYIQAGLYGSMGGSVLPTLRGILKVGQSEVVWPLAHGNTATVGMLTKHNPLTL